MKNLVAYRCTLVYKIKWKLPIRAPTQVHNKKRVVTTKKWPKSALWLLCSLHMSNILNGSMFMQSAGRATISHAKWYQGSPLLFFYFVRMRKELGNDATPFLLPTMWYLNTQLSKVLFVSHAYQTVYPPSPLMSQILFWNKNSSTAIGISWITSLNWC